MNCHKWEHRISDALDGELSKADLARLNTHLQSCESCRAYRVRLEMLQTKARELQEIGVESQHMQDLFSRLRTRLYRQVGSQPKALRAYKAGRSGWVWGSVAAVAAAAVLILLFLPGGEQITLEQSWVFSLEDSLSQIYAEIGNDADLESSFNQLLESTLLGWLEPSPSGIGVGFRDFPGFLENLSEEELKYIEQEIKKDLKS